LGVDAEMIASPAMVDTSVLPALKGWRPPGPHPRGARYGALVLKSSFQTILFVKFSFHKHPDKPGPC
jgi:hypothetical protein